MHVIKHELVEETVPLVSYFKGTIGGVDYDFEESVGPNEIGYGMAGYDKDPELVESIGFVSYMGGGKYLFLETPSPGIITLQKNILYNYQSSTEADFREFFKPSSYPYADIPNPYLCTAIDGVILAWSIPGVGSWVSFNANQEGSWFQIVGVEDGYLDNGNYYVRVKSKFKCKLYKTPDDNEHIDAEGEVVSYFVRYFP